MAKPGKDLPIPLEMRKQVRNSEIIGRKIYILDKVSAIANDVWRNASDFRASSSLSARTATMRRPRVACHAIELKWGQRHPD